MTRIHADAPTGESVGRAWSGISRDTIDPLRTAMAGRVTPFLGAIQHRRTMRRIARFSDHRLRDMGFERDWDGSILPLNRGS